MSYSRIEEYTRAYWNLSNQFYGNAPVTVSIGEGIHQVNDMLDLLNPQRPLVMRLRNFQQDIIHNNIDPADYLEMSHELEMEMEVEELNV